MKEKTKGKLFVALILAVVSMSLGCVCGMSNIGDEVSKIILPVSLSQPDDKINVIREDPEKLNEITIEEPKTQNTTKINPTKNENIIDKIINKNITIKSNNTDNNTTTNDTPSNNTQNTTPTPKDNTPIKETRDIQDNNDKVSLTSSHDTKKVKKQTNDSTNHHKKYINT
ncbi:hypothetical protein [Methanosphaera cuniculi]|uniref:hypothetical protein n=1 Tax=Methanosphaera cuniculi TaxID=1077256 RepID=UPI0026DC6110|nr:hypothetical protein [Methanosphaera cuniculi]